MMYETICEDGFRDELASYRAVDADEFADKSALERSDHLIRRRTKTYVDDGDGMLRTLGTAEELFWYRTAESAETQYGIECGVYGDTDTHGSVKRVHVLELFEVRGRGLCRVRRDVFGEESLNEYGDVSQERFYAGLRGNDELDRLLSMSEEEFRNAD